MDRVDRMDGVVGVSRVAMNLMPLCFVKLRFDELFSVFLRWRKYV